MDVDFCRTHSFYDSHILQTDELCAGLPPNDESSYNIYDEKVINADKVVMKALAKTATLTKLQ